MTALSKYQRLEGSGIWRADAEAQRRDVAVRLGEASLTILDGRSDLVLSHWALPALIRVNPGRSPALYCPTNDSDGESLETDDTALIEALETIRIAFAPPARVRWLRRGSVVLVAALLLTAFSYMPGVIAARTARIVPEAMQSQIGREAVDDLLRSGEARVCAEPNGRQAMVALRTRVLGSNWRIMVLDGLDGFEAGQMPGRIILLHRSLVERLDSPEALAGWMLAGEQLRETRDPLLDALSYGGLRATLTLLTTGALPEGVLSGYAARELRRPPQWPDASLLGGHFLSLGIPARAFADSLPPEAARLAAVLGSDLTEAPPLMSDGEWLTLQGICHE